MVSQPLQECVILEFHHAANVYFQVCDFRAKSTAPLAPRLPFLINSQYAILDFYTFPNQTP